MQRMRQPALDGAACRHHRLPDHLAAEHPLPARLRAVAAEQVHLERLEVEDGNQVDQAFGHGKCFRFLMAVIPGHACVSVEPGMSRIPGSTLRVPRNDDWAQPLFLNPVSPSYTSGSKGVSKQVQHVGTAKHCHLRRRICGTGAGAWRCVRGLAPDIPVIVADPALAMRPSRDPRATAIVAACRRLFEALGVWDQVAPTAQPILDMVVTDSKLEDATRPVFLTFAGDVEPGEPFAHMVENRHLIDALVARAEAEGIDLRATAVTQFRFAQPTASM